MWGWREAGMLDELTDDYCEWRRSEEEERWGGSDRSKELFREGDLTYRWMRETELVRMVRIFGDKF